MNLVIDIGNTHTKMAWFDKGILIESVRLEKSALEFEHLISRMPFDHCLVSCVGSYDTVAVILKEKKKEHLLLNHNTPLPVIISYKTPETLGHDRIAAVAGARYVCPLCNVLIIDMGTAITIDFVNSEGVYAGGNIAPGLSTRFRSLNEFTARLPLVEKDNSFPDFGTDTRSAIVAGVQQGIIFEINSYLEKYSSLYPACEFIITGGDADFFVPRLKKPIFVIPDLVLKGLNYILEYNTAGQKP
jgi:type III pantothenate kinase